MNKNIIIPCFNNSSIIFYNYKPENAVKKYLTILFFALLFSFSASAQQIKILTNQIGYDTAGPKHSVILGFDGDSIFSAVIINSKSKEQVYSGNPVYAGSVAHWKNWVFWTFDFNRLIKPGKYFIECRTNKGIVNSYPFFIRHNILERKTISNVIYYFKDQRCSGLLDKADRNLRFAGGRKGNVDVHGGWYDATGDYGKHLSQLSFTSYFNPQQIPLVVWSLFESYKELREKNNPDFTQYLRRILDEAMYGADYLVRIKDPKGSFYVSVAAPGADKKPSDRRIAPERINFKITSTPKKNDTYENSVKVKNRKRLIYDADFRAGGGISIAALAIASTFKVSGQFTNARYLKTAEDAFAYLEKNNLQLTNDGKENIIDDYCALMASIELYKATKKENYKLYAEHKANSLMNRFISHDKYHNYWRAGNNYRPFFHPSDAGFPVISLLSYLDIADDSAKPHVLETIKKSLEFELRVTDKVINPFGYARQLVQDSSGKEFTSFFFPHNTEAAPWWQGENARLASLASAAREASQYFKQDKKFYNELQTYADDQLNWILGLNPFDSCMLYGSGRNNPDYMFFGSYQYTNCPGGISNGITAGINNPSGIDYCVPYSVTHKDYDWRWEEQWLPHAAWFLLAVSLGSE